METTRKIGDSTFFFSKIGATKQFHIARRAAPLLKEIGPLVALIKSDPAKIEAMKKGEDIESGLVAIGAFGDALAKLSDADADFILFGLLEGVSMHQSGGGKASVAVGTQLMFKEIDLPQMLQLAFWSAMANFASFFAASPSASTPASQ